MEKKETTQFTQLCKTSERIIIIYIYIYIYLQRKTRGDPRIQQDRQDTRGEAVDRSGKGTKWEKKRETDRQREKIAPNKNKPRERKEEMQCNARIMMNTCESWSWSLQQQQLV